VKNKHLVLTVATASFCALVLASPAQAADNGFFVEGGLGWAKVKVNNTLGLDLSGNDVTWLVGGGYMFNRYIGAEGGYRWLFIPDGTVTGGATGQVLGHTYTYTGSLSLKGHAGGFYVGPVFQLPLDDKFSLRARAGAFFWDTKYTLSSSNALSRDGVALGAAGASFSDSPNGTTWYGGVGAAYKFSPATSLELAYNYTKFDSIKFNTLDLRLKYSF
jgi:opacity protein-like surface antigen